MPEPIFTKIQRRDFAEPDRNQVQEMAIEAVREYPEEFFERYENLENDSGENKTFWGRYICADMFKECFALFNRSAEDANRYNASIHNTAAVLAAEQFARMLGPEKREPGRDTVIFLTGIPGAGKTSLCMVNNQLPENCHLIFEGQLARPEPSLVKIKQVLEAGFKAKVMVVHAKPEDALERTFKRFEIEGRGATISLMADLQANLPHGLKTVWERFGDQVAITIVTNTADAARKKMVGWENLELLRSEGSYEQIKERLVARLEEHQARGTVSQSCYNQAYGRFTYERPSALDRRTVAGQRSHQNARDRRRPGEIEGIAKPVSAPLPQVNAAGSEELNRLQTRLAAELRQLEARLAAHRDNQYQLEERLAWLEKTAEIFSREEVQWGREIAHRDKNSIQKGSGFFFAAQGQIFTEKYQAQLARQLQITFAKAAKSNQPTLVGLYRGFKIEAAADGPQGLQFTLQGAGPKHRATELGGAKTDFKGQNLNVSGFIKKLDNFLNRFEENRKSAASKFKQKQQALATASQLQPFPQMNLLDALRRDYDQIQRFTENASFKPGWKPESQRLKESRPAAPACGE